MSMRTNFFYSNMTPELSADSNVNHFILRDEYARILTRVLTGDGLQMNRWKS